MLTTLWLTLAGAACALQLDTGSFPKPLTPQEEQHYLALAAQGDPEARNILIERNLRLVAHIMKKYYAQESDQEDLISIGTIGLIKAISTYKMEKNIKLATYASRCIENAILTWATLRAERLYPRLQRFCMAHFRPVIGRFVCPFSDAELCTLFIHSFVRCAPWKILEATQFNQRYRGYEGIDNLPDRLRCLQEWESGRKVISIICWERHFKGRA